MQFNQEGPDHGFEAGRLDVATLHHRAPPTRGETDVRSLVSYRRGCQRLIAAWPTFLAKRQDRLAQQRRFGAVPEKAAENILEDLFTTVLDWSVRDLNHQVHFADLVLTRLGIKYLVVEAKRPGALAWNQRSVDAALEQAQRYADEQKVRSIAVSDGVMLYARDPIPGGYRDRALARLDQPDPPLDLWWLSMDGMYRQREDSSGVPLQLLPPLVEATPAAGTVGEVDPLHAKYKLPARCFAYVGSTADPKTWHLPYLLADGRPDPARLPKAIQAIVSNFRGTHLNSHTVPEAAVPEVLVTLARAARLAGKLPADEASSAQAYVRLQAVLDQLGRLSEIAV